MSLFSVARMIKLAQKLDNKEVLPLIVEGDVFMAGAFSRAKRPTTAFFSVRPVSETEGFKQEDDIFGERRLLWRSHLYN